MKKTVKFIICACLALLPLQQGQACTSAIIGASLNPSGRPILWKHRDTGEVDNKVEYIPSRKGELAYVALFNASDKALKEAWIGMNEAGFAIMNTASYNIKDDKVSEKQMDKEGLVMTRALKTCRTVDDFENLLKTLPRPMGVEANFGVIDALGNGAYFETNNHLFRRFDLKDAEEDMIVRTNYSHSGRANEGFGFVREANACHLLTPYMKEKSITPEVLTESVSRSFYHDMNKRDYALGPDRWIIDQDFIPRYKSSATVAIEGCVPLSDISELESRKPGEEYVMWTGLGYPPVSEIRAVRCRADGVDPDLRGTLPNGHAPLSDKARKMRDEVFPIHKGNGDKYIDITRLYNDSASGLAQKMIEINRQTYRRERGK